MSLTCWTNVVLRLGIFIRNNLSAFLSLHWRHSEKCSAMNKLICQRNKRDILWMTDGLFNHWQTMYRILGEMNLHDDKVHNSIMILLYVVYWLEEATSSGYMLSETLLLLIDDRVIIYLQWTMLQPPTWNIVWHFHISNTVKRSAGESTSINYNMSGLGLARYYYVASK